MEVPGGATVYNYVVSLPLTHRQVVCLIPCYSEEEFHPS